MESRKIVFIRFLNPHLLGNCEKPSLRYPSALKYLCMLVAVRCNSVYEKGKINLESVKELKTFSPKLKLGEIVPYLDLPSNRGSNVNVWVFKQRKNLVIFFNHGTDCNPCSKKLRELAEKYKEIQELEAEVLVVSLDDLEKIKEYAMKNHIPFLSLSDRSLHT